jgi:hypothetical protein
MRAGRVIPVALLAIGVLLAPRLAWWERDSIQLNLGIGGPGHESGESGETSAPRGLRWMLDYMKARPTGRPRWNLSPGEIEQSELRSLSAVYLTGSLHRSMGFAEDSKGVERPVSGLGSDVGGSLKPHLITWLNARDGRALSEFTQRGGAVIGENGLLAGVEDAEARWRLEDCFRVRWTGWVGLSVDDIGDPSETPGWVLQWVRKTGDITTVSGPAVILMNEGQMLLLRAGIDLDEDFHEIAWLSTADRPEDRPADKGPRAAVPYRGWFEVLREGGGCRVFAEHRLHVTESGEQRLASAGLSKSFPCFVGYQGAYRSYYLAAAVSDDGPSDFWARTAGYPSVAAFTSSKLGGRRGRTYWEFYYPLMRDVVLEAAIPREEK